MKTKVCAFHVWRPWLWSLFMPRPMWWLGDICERVIAWRYMWAGYLRDSPARVFRVSHGPFWQPLTAPKRHLKQCASRPKTDLSMSQQTPANRFECREKSLKDRKYFFFWFLFKLKKNKKQQVIFKIPYRFWRISISGPWLAPWTRGGRGYCRTSHKCAFAFASPSDSDDDPSLTWHARVQPIQFVHLPRAPLWHLCLCIYLRVYIHIVYIYIHVYVYENTYTCIWIYTMHYCPFLFWRFCVKGRYHPFLFSRLRGSVPFLRVKHWGFCSWWLPNQIFGDVQSSNIEPNDRVRSMRMGFFVQRFVSWPNFCT
jgi:hypothetical protein